MVKTAFDTLVGYEDIKLELQRVLDQLTNPEKYAAVGISEPHGILLHGEPGVGKSSFARCFLNACGRSTFVCRKDKPNGDFVKEIVRVFEEATQAAPSVILLDDLDKFSNEDERHRDAEEFVTVQACIDQARDHQVFVLATANNLRKLPASLVRPGRFDAVLEVRTPEGEDARQIVDHYLKNKSYVADLDVNTVSRLLEGYSCAQLEAVVNQAGVYAAFDGRTMVEMGDMIKAILCVVFKAPENSRRNRAAQELVACHEAGHAIVAELLEPGSVDLVSVLCHHSDTNGVTALHRDENYFFSKKLMEVRVMCLLAGKAATEICHGMVDTGVDSDMRRVFDIVHRFVDDYCSYGFDKFVYTDPVSQDLLSRRDSQVAAVVDRFYRQTRELLEENREKLDALTALLLQEQTVLNRQIREIMEAA